ncbi:MAG: hypothetical protein CSYNP_03315 [Syntrophus sp. SKADARSKE-3]|nr:hypothetical protein [Syntrophus sp. SKADARSKE-3]
MRHLTLMFTLIVCLTAALLCLPVPIHGSELSLENVLPRTFADGWSPENKTKLYSSDTLYEHINGEAELYMPYGFDLLVTVSYANKKYPDQLVVADVYRMGSLLDAFGIYSNYRRPEDNTIPIGAEGFLSSTQMMFYQGRYFIRLQATGTTGLKQEIFQACAKKISGNLPADSSHPRELEFLSVPGLIPKTERYLAKSLLGYAFFRRGFVMDAAPAGDSMRIFVVTEDSKESARKSFDAYLAYLREEGQSAQVVEMKGGRVLTAADSLYGDVIAEESGSYLVGAIKIKDKDAAKRIIGQLRAKIGNR